MHDGDSNPHTLRDTVYENGNDIAYEIAKNESEMTKMYYIV